MDLFYAGDPNMAPEGTFVFGDGFFEAGGDPFFVGIPGPDQFGPDGSFDQFGPGPGPGTGGDFGPAPNSLDPGSVPPPGPGGDFGPGPGGPGYDDFGPGPGGPGFDDFGFGPGPGGPGFDDLVWTRSGGQGLMTLDLDQVPAWVGITMIRWRGVVITMTPWRGEHTMNPRLPTMTRMGVVSITTTMSFRISSKIKSYPELLTTTHLLQDQAH